jgi:hypothetical protein
VGGYLPEKSERISGSFGGRMKNILLLLLLSTFAFCGGVVPDTTQSSGKVGAIMTDPNNVDKLDNIMKGITTGVAITKYVVKNKDEIQKTMKEMKDAKNADLQKYREELKVKYKNSKGGMGFFNFVKATQGFLDDILKTAADRIDMWRTTLPTLQAWGQSMKLFAQQTATVYKSFKWKDLIDIDRRWSRQFEKINMGWIYTYGYGFLNYLWGLGNVEGIQSLYTRYQSYIYEWQIDSTRMEREKFNKLQALKKKIESEEFTAMEALSDSGRMYLFHRLPVEEIETAIIGLSNVIDIIGSDIDTAGRKKSKNDWVFELEDLANDENNTYLTTQRVLATIKMERTNIEGQRTTLQQIQSNLAHFYARVQMMEMEEKAMLQGASTETLKNIVGTKIPTDTANKWLPNDRMEYDDDYSVTSQIWGKPEVTYHINWEKKEKY